MYKIERYAEAVDEYRQAVSLKPEWSAGWRQLGKALLKTGETGGAGEAFIRGLAESERQGDLQTKREIESYLKRMTTGGTGNGE